MCTIHKIDEETIRMLSSGQVIISPASVVKELFENALDAGATTIQVSLKNYCIDEISVTDNGSGIHPEDVPLLGQRHCTSKIAGIDDVTKVATYGFRGEALYSIASVADVEVQTCDGTSRGVSLNINTRVTRTIPRKQGTTVVVKRLFHNNAIRREELAKGKSKELQRIVALLQRYALIMTNIRVVLTHAAKAGTATVLQSSGKSLRENLFALFGKEAAEVRHEIECERDGVRLVGVCSTPQDTGRQNADRVFLFANRRPIEHKRLETAIATCWRAVTATNRRRFPTVVLNIIVDEYDPNVTPEKSSVFFLDEDTVVRVVQDHFATIWKTDAFTDTPTPHNDHSLLGSLPDDMKIPKRVSPAQRIKTPEPLSPVRPGSPAAEQAEHRTVVIKHLLDTESPLKRRRGKTSARTSPQRSFVSQTSEVIDSGEVLLGVDDLQSSIDTKATAKSINTIRRFSPVKTQRSTRLATHTDNEDSVSDADIDAPPAKRIPFVDQDPSLSPILAFNINEEVPDLAPSSPNKVPAPPQPHTQRVHFANTVVVPSQRAASQRIATQPRTPHSPTPNAQPTVPTQKETEDPNTSNNILDGPLDTQKRLDEGVDTQEPNDGMELDEGPSLFASSLCSQSQHVAIATNKLYVNVADMALLHDHLLGAHQDFPLCLPPHTNQDITDMQRSMKKSEIKTITVIGQFNKGFIIGRLKSDIYIIDQHAADEIYNYETLLRNDGLNVQPLLSPLSVSLSAEDEVFVQENAATFRPFGFEVRFDAERPPTQRVSLVKVYSHKSGVSRLTCRKVHFGAAEFVELVQELRGGFSEDVVIARKHKMFATEACRMSIMIGEALTMRQMQTILENLSGLKKPWRCPHGRPTLRHLYDLRKAQNGVRAAKEESITAFCN